MICRVSMRGRYEKAMTKVASPPFGPGVLRVCRIACLGRTLNGMFVLTIDSICHKPGLQISPIIGPFGLIRDRSRY